MQLVLTMIWFEGRKIKLFRFTRNNLGCFLNLGILLVPISCF